ncbi:IclR family transcriptional regulator [Ornithinibacillus sp. 4-3]|uniref:IclR family transcriptional regulator n=1 Tax=Ornithinibacillus sp. 4-3 TaxID=3231488 RepID=A0AB39HNY2_9BACI
MSETQKNSNRYTINSIDKALDLLEILSEKSFNLLELVEQLDQPKSSIYRMITTFEKRGYITREKEDGKYCLGLKMLELTKNLLEKNTLISVANAEMQKLVSKTGESVNLGVLDGNEILYVAVFEGEHQLKFTEALGSKSPIHATAIGKTLAAYLPNEQLNELLQEIEFKKITPNTITNKTEFNKELEFVREKGYALDNEEIAIGARCIAAPIFDMFGNIEAAISISGAVHRLSNEQFNEMTNEVVSSAQSISRKLGFDK